MLSSGLNNTAVGYNIGFSLSTGGQNTLIGSGAGGGSITSQSNLTMIGYLAGSNINNILATNVICIGSGSQATSSSVQNEVVIGEGNISSLYCRRVLWIQSVSGVGGNNGNTLIGGAVGNHSNGSNTVIGYLAGTNMAAAANNTILGVGAGQQLTTGNNNVFVGYQAGTAVTGASNTLLGYTAGSTLTTGSNNTLIGNGASPTAVGVSNEITLGNASIATLRCQVTSITALSDSRDKADVADLASGLNIIEQLKPVTFKWDKREWYDDGVADGTKKENKTSVGFLAQDLKKLQEDNGCEYFNLVYESNPDKLEATYGNLLLPLIKSVQELSQQVKDLKTTVTEQQATIDSLLNK